jgi:hypothetical protein
MTAVVLVWRRPDATRYPLPAQSNIWTIAAIGWIVISRSGVVPENATRRSGSNLVKPRASVDYRTVMRSAVAERAGQRRHAGEAFAA